jgi:DNA gyrase subunit B
MADNYTSKDILVLDEIDHIRLNPSMYISDTETPTHLIEEVLDNSLDEASAGFANVVAVLVDTKENMFSVIDNGRGIPVDGNVPFIISTKLHSGGKFKTKKTAYLITSGLHGIGLVAVNALCDIYTVEIYRDNKHVKLTFKDAGLIKNVEEDFAGQVPFSTKVQFKPTKKIFQSLIPDINRLRKRLLVASLETPNCTFVLNVDGVKEIIKITKEDFFKFQCLAENDIEYSQPISVTSKIGVEEFNATFSFSFTGSTTPRYISSVNLLPVDEGGSHVNVFNEIIKDFFVAKAKKYDKKFQPGDVFCGLRCYFSLKLVAPDFSGQSKGKLNNRKDDLIKLTSKLKQGLEDVFIKDPILLDTILCFFEDYRTKLNHKKVSTLNGGRRVSTKFTKLADCISRNGELFIVEGDSAGGSFKQCRDPNMHAILPLKGKIPSIITKKEILKHKEVHELIESLGTGTGPHFDITKLKYDKIVSAPDADEDGGHIFCLLTITLAVLVPEIIKAGKFYLARTPLYAITNNKNIFIPLWSPEELQKARDENKNLTRIKGLGEMDPWMLKICALDVPTRRLVQVKWTENLERILELFESKDAKRLLLSGEWIL